MIKSNLNNLNGWIIIDKQSGVTSRQIVTKLSKILKIRKIGHGGTLDPMGTGVLPVAIGEATKLISFIQNKNKKYTFTVKWGESTDTDDIEGKVLERSIIRPKTDQIKKVLSSFLGKIDQIPPIYSAIKIDGKRSYNLARNNISIGHRPRKVEVHKLKLKKSFKNSADFEVICGKGTYVRSLARDIAEKLNTKGHVTKLRRHFVGNFDEKDTIFIDFFEEILHSPSFLNKIKPIEKVLDDIPALLLTQTEATKLRQGQKLKLDTLKFINRFFKEYPDYRNFERVFSFTDNKIVALIEIDNGLVRPKRIINYK